jgi:integrase/recombinase XerD
VSRLQVTDIDSRRRRLRVARGKRTKDRDTLLSARLLTALHASWQVARPQPWLFPGRDPQQPMTDATARLVFTQAQAKADIRKRGSIHVLRHCFATHLLEAHGALRTMQILIGHASITSTAYYLHLTRKTLDQTQNPFDLLDLSHLSTFQEVPPCQPS